jgi:hypothetical protein
MMKKKPHSSRALVISGVVSILLALVYTWWWLAFAYGARAGVERWAEERQAEGWRVSFDDITLRGYPFVLSMRLHEPKIAKPGQFDWQGPEVVATVSPLSPTTVHLRAPGKHQLRIPGVDTVSLEAEYAQGNLALSRTGRPSNGSLSLRNVATDSSLGKGNIGGLQVRVEEMDAPSGRTIEAIPNNIAFGVMASDVTLPSQIKTSMGRHVTAAVLRGRVRGQWEPAPFTTALANWRDGGGVIELDEIGITWDPLTLSGNGTLALDQRLQPQVAMTARMTGFFETVDALANTGVIRAKDVSVAKMVLGLLSKKNGNGPAVLELPLTIQDGTFYAGPAAIGKVPELPWQAPPPVPLPSTYPQAKRDELAKPGMTVGPKGEVTGR